MGGDQQLIIINVSVFSISVSPHTFKYCGDAVEQSTLPEVGRKTTTNHLPAATRMTSVCWCVVHMADNIDTKRTVISVFVKTSNATVERNDIDLYRRLSEAVQCIDEISWQTSGQRYNEKPYKAPN